MADPTPPRHDPRDLDEFAHLDTLLSDMAPAASPPPELRSRALAAIAAEAAALKPRARRAGWRPRLPQLAIGGALTLAAVALAIVLAPRDSDDQAPLELRAQLVAPNDPRLTAQADVTKTGIGRVIRFDTTKLPILPKGEYYELWFVGPGDSPSQPNRISAGTFHPDEHGRSRVTFAAAVDPAKYPVLSVTAEPGDGDPSPSGPDILRSTAPA